MPTKKEATAPRATVDDLAKFQQALVQKLIGLRRVIAPAGRKETEGSGEDYPIQIRATRWPAKYPWACRAVAAIDAAWEALRNVMVCHSQVDGLRTLPSVLMNYYGRPSILALLEHLRGITELPADDSELQILDKLTAKLNGKPPPALLPVPVDLCDREADVFAYIRDNAPVIAKRIANHLGLGPKSLDRPLAALKARGLIDNRRGAGYFLRAS